MFLSLYPSRFWTLKLALTVSLLTRLRLETILMSLDSGRSAFVHPCSTSVSAHCKVTPPHIVQFENTIQFTVFFAPREQDDIPSVMKFGMKSTPSVYFRMLNFTLIGEESWIWTSQIFQNRSNLKFLPPQTWHDVRIQVKIGLKEPRKFTLLCHIFRWLVQGWVYEPRYSKFGQYGDFWSSTETTCQFQSCVENLRRIDERLWVCEPQSSKFIRFSGA